MKVSTCCIAFTLISATTCCLAQTQKPATTAPATQTAPINPGRQLRFLCVHQHGNGDVGSTILYKARTVNVDPKEDPSTTVKGSIHVGRLTSIVVRFTHVNTFCYDYEAGVTKQVTFYGGSLPSQIKPFFVGGLVSPLVAAGSGDFNGDQKTFQGHFEAYKPLGQLAVDVTQAFATAIDPKKDNKDIREDIRKGLRKVFQYNDRDVAAEDFTIRQAELKTGLATLTKDLDKLRTDLAGATAGSDDFKTQMAFIQSDEEAVSGLSAELANYDTAIADLQQAKSAQDYVERTVMLDSKSDEYEVTATVSLLNSKPTQASETEPPAPFVRTFVVDVTGVGGFDFSTGVVATHPVSHDYYLYKDKNNGGAITIGDGGGTDPNYLPAIFVDYYTRPAPGQFALGPAFGVDISTGKDFFLGAALVRAGAQRFSLVGGLSLSKITLLNGDTVGLPPVNGASIQTKSRYLGGYFFGLTFNFGA